MPDSDRLHHGKELDQLRSVWVKKHHENQLMVGGSINTFTVVNLRKEAQEWLTRLSKSYNTVVFDMEPSNPEGTVCVSFILCLYRHAEKLKLTLEFINVPDQILRIVQLSGLTDILQLASSKKRT